MARRRVAMAFGTFDIFHKGHESYLKQARSFSDHLIVVIARDENVLKTKGAYPKNNEKTRLERVKKSGLADEVVLGDLHDRFKVIEKFRPDCICLGYDQKVNVSELKENLLKFGLGDAKIERLNSFQPEKFKSSKLI